MSQNGLDKNPASYYKIVTVILKIYQLAIFFKNTGKEAKE